jgi:16S rRNA (adenine1518-N6/adenine1519-N6)-dimethyltransferase
MPKYSQNFLTNPKIAGEIVEAVGQNDFDQLVEIGPGKGFLTKKLQETFGSNFTAVEIDSAMVGYLKENIASDKLPRIINADFFKFFNFAVFMFQKEVADRITAAAGSKAYGVLSLVVQSRAKVRKIINVKKIYFKPVPKVNSAVVEFKRRDVSLFENKTQEEKFIKTVKYSFVHKRKTILNSLSKSLHLPKEKTQNLLESAGIDPKLRPEDISLSQYLKLSKLLN